MLKLKKRRGKEGRPTLGQIKVLVCVRVSPFPPLKPKVVACWQSTIGKLTQKLKSAHTSLWYPAHRVNTQKKGTAGISQKDSAYKTVEQREQDSQEMETF